MIKAIILDFDGLIVDTETFNFTVTKEAYDKFNLTITLDLWRQMRGCAKFSNRTVGF